jgi:hypothetical protein
LNWRGQRPAINGSEQRDDFWYDPYGVIHGLDQHGYICS